MIVQEDIGNNLVRTYSDQDMMIQGGFPEGLYAEAIDPISAGRTYVETDIPVPHDEQVVTQIDLSASSFGYPTVQVIGASTITL